ncbi:MAG: hypothetical protein HDR21_13305 [Lachnospiraceae bacterium]|nr:hypothetical protein [Lachnospiraceae bacterium]
MNYNDFLETVKVVESDGYKYSYNENLGTHDFSNDDEIISIYDYINEDEDATDYDKVIAAIKKEFSYLF